MFGFELPPKNKYYNLYKDLRTKILQGKFKVGEKLPSKRALAADLGVSVVTVQQAYELLLSEGYVISKERSGYFVDNVAPLQPPAKPAEGRGAAEKAQTEKSYKIDFVKGSAPAALFPFSTWAKLHRRVLSDCGEHLLERVPCDGDYALKRAISAYLFRARGIDAPPERVIIGAGAEHLYGVIVQLLGRDKTFAVENPGYGKISSAYALNGARVLPVPVGADGIDIDAVTSSPAYAVHVSPSHQYPTGAVTSATARKKLVDWADFVGGYVIEDDYDSEFRLTGKPMPCMPALSPDRVIYVNTFSKTLAPSMRMGYMVLPQSLYEKFLSMFSSGANVVPLFEQRALAEMLDGGYFERHLSRLKNHYRAVRKRIGEVLAAFDPAPELLDTGSGLHMIAKFPAGATDAQIKDMADSLGINLKCLSDYALAPIPELDGCAVINYSTVTVQQIEEFLK